MSQSFTIKRDTRIFKLWTIIKLTFCLITTLLYPYYNVNGFPGIAKLMALEFVFFVEIILNFFLQDLDEEGKSKNEPQELIVSKYMRGSFIIDLLTFLPLGYTLEFYDHRFKILWLIKALRIKELHGYLGKRSFAPIINFYINFLRGNSLNDPDLSHEINRDLIYITRKIYFRNIFKIIRLILQILFVVYFLAQYWFICVDVFDTMHDTDSYSFFINEHWDLTETQDLTTTAMYFALTTLSTTGLGDLHPITDNERMLGIILIFFGVIMFSYILGELRYLMSNIDSLNGEIE